MTGWRKTGNSRTAGNVEEWNTQRLVNDDFELLLRPLTACRPTDTLSVRATLDQWRPREETSATTVIKEKREKKELSSSRC